LTGPPPLSKRDEELGKYRSLYEESMNPFEKFRGHVRGRSVDVVLLARARSRRRTRFVHRPQRS